MTANQLLEIWMLFKDYLDKKTADAAAEKFVEMISDFGFDDQEFKELLDNDEILDDAIKNYIDFEEDFIEEE